MKILPTVLLSILVFFFGAYSAVPDEPSDTAVLSISWGPQFGTSGLSKVPGAQDSFGAETGDALARAAQSVPNGASQSSLTDAGRTAHEMSVKVIRDENGFLVYELSDGEGMNVRAPGISRRDAELALFANVPAFIEPDPSSYPHDLLGFWARNGEAGAFWGASQPIPDRFGGKFNSTGSGAYSGDAVVLLSEGGTVRMLQAHVELEADFPLRTVAGVVSRFLSVDGGAKKDLFLSLVNTQFLAGGGNFSGETSAGIPGNGNWGGRWSDSQGQTLGGTFGFAASNGSIALIGAYTASRNSSDSGGNPDHAVSTSR